MSFSDKNFSEIASLDDFSNRSSKVFWIIEIFALSDKFGLIIEELLITSFLIFSISCPLVFVSNIVFA